VTQIQGQSSANRGNPGKQGPNRKKRCGEGEGKKKSNHLGKRSPFQKESISPQSRPKEDLRFKKKRHRSELDKNNGGKKEKRDSQAKKKGTRVGLKEVWTGRKRTG